MPYPKYQIHFDPSIFTSHMMLVRIYLFTLDACKDLFTLKQIQSCAM